MDYLPLEKKMSVLPFMESQRHSLFFTGS